MRLINICKMMRNTQRQRHKLGRTHTPTHTHATSQSLAELTADTQSEAPFDLYWDSSSTNGAAGVSTESRHDQMCVSCYPLHTRVVLQLQCLTLWASPCHTSHASAAARTALQCSRVSSQTISYQFNNCTEEA